MYNLIYKNVQFNFSIIKKHLKDLDIYICDTFSPEEDFYALNQIIITSYFINEKGEIKNTYEFTFPINGCYKDREEFGKVRYDVR